MRSISVLIAEIHVAINTPFCSQQLVITFSWAAVLVLQCTATAAARTTGWRTSTATSRVTCCSAASTPATAVWRTSINCTRLSSNRMSVTTVCNQVSERRSRVTIASCYSSLLPPTTCSVMCFLLALRVHVNICTEFTPLCSASS